MRFPPLRTLLKVLAFVLISAVFTIGLAMKIGNLRLFAHTYNLSAVFDDASGVFKGDAVKLAGVDVGRVTGTKIENGHAVVDFNVDKSVKLTRDSVVAIRWRNVLGLRFLYVYPGTEQGRTLQDGDVVPLSQTEDAGDIGQFLNELGPILQAIDPQKANEFLDAVNTALGGSEVAVRQLLTDGASLAGQLGTKDKQIGELVDNSSKIMAAYASQSANLGRILDDLDTLGGKLAGVTSQVDSLITNFADVQHRLSHVLTASHGNIDATLSELQAVLATLGSNKQNLEQTLCSLPVGVGPYYQTSSWGQWFNVRVTTVTFRDNQGRLISKQGELPTQRGGPGTGGPVFTCGGAAIPNSPPASSGPIPASSSSGGNGLSSFLDFVTRKKG
jgi:phospholipid/cholesterol/gamma-HCH transport system substrate-binding protein